MTGVPPGPVTEPAGAVGRPISMRRVLGTLTAALVTCVALGATAGCGSSSSSTATEPATSGSDPSGLPSRPRGPVEGARMVRLISLTGAGGQVQPIAAPLNTHADVAAFARQFRLPGFRHRIRIVLAEITPGAYTVGQIIAVGCDHPPGAEVIVNKDGNVVLVPHEVASPLEECLAPVTTVAIAALPTK